MLSSLCPSRPALRLLFLTLSLTAAGCSAVVPPAEVRGNRVDSDELKELVPGTSTKADAASLLGSPTAQGTFDDNSWYYISELTRPIIGGTQSVIKQQVVVLTFNNKGVLEHVRKLDEQDALAAPIVSHTTPSPGTEAGFFQQLLGNVGRFSPGGFGNSSPSANGP